MLRYLILVCILISIVFAEGCSKVSNMESQVGSEMSSGNTQNSKNSSPENSSTSSSEKAPQWELVWSDEFNGIDIDRSNWNIKKGSENYHSQLQCYTDRPENVRVENGNLIIEACEEKYEGCEYTSAFIHTRGLRSFKYGKIEMRAKLPIGKGMWPAFWAMGDPGSPGYGEIDILEMVGGGKGFDDTIFGTMHWDITGPNKIGGKKRLASGNYGDNYHTFSIEWDESQICWYMDGVKFLKGSITAENRAVFDWKFYLLINLAIGGDWAGSPNKTTEFPQKYMIDWVRVFKR